MVDVDGQREKRAVAGSSVIASLFLTAGKLVVGIMTGSLGILSEAAHSALDLGAAIITYFAVKVSDKPADEQHHYGHAKVENFSALVEAALLFITCIWIIREAVLRLFFRDVHVDITVWSFAVIIVSIVVDFSRSRALARVAKKYKSQALEADALHFSSDILSSLVVLVGLIMVRLDINYADPVAALIVAVIVIAASWRLARRTVDALLDKAPSGLDRRIAEEVMQIPGVAGVHKVRLREAGGSIKGDLHVVLERRVSFVDGHRIAGMVEEKLAQLSDDILVHFEPEEDWDQVQVVIEKTTNLVHRVMDDNNSVFKEYHDLEVGCGPEGTCVSLHIVLPRGTSVGDARECCNKLENEIKKDLVEANVRFQIEPCEGSCHCCYEECEDRDG